MGTERQIFISARLLLVFISLALSLLAFAQPEIVEPPDGRTEAEKAISTLRTSTNINEHTNSAARLGILGDKTAVPALIDVMLKDDARVAQSCVTALQQLGDRRATPALLQMLAKDPHNATQLTSSLVEALIDLPDPAMKDPMLDLACRSDAPPQSRLLALEALENLKDPTIGTKIIPLISTQQPLPVAVRAALLAGRMGMTEAVPGMLSLLLRDTSRDSATTPVHPPRRRRYYNGMGPQQMGDDTPDDPFSSTAERPRYALQLIQALAPLQSPLAIEPLTQQLGNASPAVRTAAIDALAAYQRPELAICFLMALRDADAPLRAHGAAALGTCKKPSVVPALLDALHDENAGVRGAAAEALGHYGQPAYDAVAKLPADEKSADVRAAAVEALGALHLPGTATMLIPLLSDIDAATRGAAAAALSRLGAGDFDAVLPLLQSPDAGLRACAVQVLGRAKTPVPAALLDDGSLDVRRWAVYALGQAPDYPATSIKRALLDIDPAVRAEAIRVIGARGTLAQAPTLIAAMTHGTPTERIAAESALVTLTKVDFGFNPTLWQTWAEAQQ